jgi:TonB family protein
METLITECFVRSALIAIGVTAVLFALRVKAARVRHAVWTSAVIVMLLLPIWTAWGPKAVLHLLKPESAPSQMQPAVETIQTSTAARPVLHRAAWSAENWLAALYLLGLVALLGRLLLGTVRARTLVRRSRRVAGRLTSGSCVTPMTVGWLRPAVILPAGWTQWPQAQLNAVLAHEEEHARRRDPLAQWLSLLNRAVFWFHPLAWWLSRQLSVLAEEACDDAALARGHNPLEYSGYLLDLARRVRESAVRPNIVAMAMPGVFLPRRIRRIASGAPIERVSRRRKACLAAACAAICTAFTGGAVGYETVTQTGGNTAVATTAQDAIVLERGPDSTPSTPHVRLLKRVKTITLAQAQTSPAAPNPAAGGIQPAQFAGSVADPTGAVVPNAVVALTNTDTSAGSSATTDPNGAYRFESVEPGNYKVTVKVPGFKTETQTGIVVASGENHNGGKMFLQLGAMSESVSVTGSRSAPVSGARPTGNPANPINTLGPMTTLAPIEPAHGSPPTTRADATGRIRVGGMVQPANLLNAVKPVYPVDLQQQGIQGTVKFEATISKEGTIAELKLVSGPPMLVQAALEAVRQWRYRPTQLNGEPVETVTTIDVNFQLKD